ncbi:MAG: TPM domain-containing protein [Bacteroidota bacterium]
MILTQLLYLFSILMLPSQYVFDNASLLDSLESSQLSERLVSLDRDRAIKIGVITTVSAEFEIYADSILSFHKSSFIGNESGTEDALFIVLVADKSVCYFYSATDGLEVEIPESTRFAIEEYGYTMFDEGYYYQGLENILDGLLNKWGENGEFITERRRADEAREAAQLKKIGEGLSGTTLIVILFLPIGALLGVLLLVYLLIVLFRKK